MIGFWTLLYKELLRFWKVAFQTVGAPVLTALLYLMIFGHVLDEHVQVHGVRYTSFLCPGLVMMQVLQNAFANSSSSLIQAKITGSIVFVLLPPIPYSAFFAAYVLAALARGLMVGIGVLLATVWFAEITVVAPFWVLAFALLGGAMFAALGMIAGIWSEKFDQLAGFSELPDHAADHAFRRLLFNSFAACPLAGRVTLQSCFLYDRRLPLWLFRRLRRSAGNQPRSRFWLLRSRIPADAESAQAGLEIKSLKP
jgi:hypothetical protein